MNARLSVHGSLKRTKRREHSSARSRVRLSDQLFSSILWNCSRDPECRQKSFFAHLCNLNKPSMSRNSHVLYIEVLYIKSMSNTGIYPLVSGTWEYDNVRIYVRVENRSKNGKTVEPRRRSPRISISFYVEIDSVSVSDILMAVGLSAIYFIMFR